MNLKLISITGAIALMISTVPVNAQSRTPSPAPKTVGPTVAASAIGIRAPSAPAEKRSTAAAPDTHLGAGTNVALMVVGGAALIIGAVIGGTAGVLLAVAGAAIGLFGLYHFIQ